MSRLAQWPGQIETQGAVTEYILVKDDDTACIESRTALLQQRMIHRHVQTTGYRLVRQHPA
jgi:hypothetical protein